MSNDQDNDILDAADNDGDAGFEDFDTGGGGFADAVKTNPMVKVGIVVAAFAVIAGGIILFGGKKEPIAGSAVKEAAEVTSVPGQDQVSPVYRQAVEDRNEQEVEKAVREGSSAIPVPIGPPRGVLEVEKEEAVEDPLERWRKIQEERLRKEQEALAASNNPLQPQQEAVDPYAEQKQALADSMATQMQSILEGIDIKKMQSVKITDGDYMKNKRAQAEEARAEVEAEEAEAAAAAVPTTEILLEAGRIEYAQLIIEANTDAPGPVLAEIASGPLAGSRMIGTFQATDEYLTLQFNAVIVDGKALSTKAIALDPATSKPGLITEIDHKYFQRVIIPAAASFIEGIGGAIAESGSTTVSAGEGTTTSAQNDLDTRQEFFKGVEEAAGKVSEILDEDAGKVEPMLRVAAGTHLGILFLESVERPLDGGGTVQASAAGPDQAAVQPNAALAPAMPNQIQSSETPTSR
ncbi:MAG: DotG/IcmE/VirB10 family protein [Micavibrio aeruginosavorus]|nr:DotG/IcmE/VirB10 family protein [Micavibrio aeruginosavorus]